MFKKAAAAAPLPKLRVVKRRHNRRLRKCNRIAMFLSEPHEIINPAVIVKTKSL